MKPKFFQNNRIKFIEEMKNNSIAIFNSNEKNMKGDEEFFYFNDVNLFYLTGIKQAKTNFLIFKKNKKIEQYLFVEKTSKFLETWEGHKLSKTEAKKISKIENVLYLEDYESKLLELSKKVKNMYVTNDNSKTLLRKLKLKKENSLEILSKLRQNKQTDEIKEIKKAMKITKIAFENIISNIKQIKSEQEIEALLTYHYTKNLAKHSYHPIIASSQNSNIMHYIDNNQKLKSNKLILIDSGAEINNYKTDVTRTFPKAKFTNRQKQVYQAVLDINKNAIKRLKPGVNKREWEKENFELYNTKLIELKLIPDKSFEENKKLIREFCSHSTGHFLGLDTHDIGDYKTKFKENDLFTVEPGIYIKKEKIGIRIEDNVLITKKGNKVLSKSIPKEIKDIENLIK